MKDGTAKEIPIVMEGPHSGYSNSLDGDNFVYIPYNETGALNVRNNAITVII